MAPRPLPLLAPLRGIHTSAVRRSHVGKVPVPIPASVVLSLPPSAISPLLRPDAREAQRSITVSGPLGSAVLPIHPSIILSPPTAAAPAVAVSVHNPQVKVQRSLWGRTRTLLGNAVTGVSTGFTLDVKLVGVGYRATLEPIPPVFLELAKRSSSALPESLPRERLNMKLGFAHPVLIDIPIDIKVAVTAPTKIVLTGTDKQKLGQFAATIRQWRRPEPYRGKGIFVGDETIRLKEIKKK